MKTFKQFVGEAVSRHPEGTYISAQLDDQSKNKLYDFTKTLELSDPAPKEQYHSTIIYSRVGVPETEYFDYPESFKGTFKEWRIFENRIQGTKCLVAIVDSPELHGLHERIMNETAATYDFDEYHPHVTLTYNYEYDKVPDIKPDFSLNYSGVTVKPLDPTFIPSKDKPES